MALGVGPDGTATVAWSKPGAPPGAEMVARRIAPDGTPEEGVQVLSGPEPLAYWPDLAMAPDGAATVVWSERAGADGRALVERRIEPDGTLEPTTNTLDSTAAYDPVGYFGEPEVEGAADGSAVALWEHVGADDELWARRIEPDGSWVTPSFWTASAPPANYRFPRLAVAPDGSATVSWRSEGNVKVLEPGQRRGAGKRPPDHERRRAAAGGTQIPRFGALARSSRWGPLRLLGGRLRRGLVPLLRGPGGRWLSRGRAGGRPGEDALLVGTGAGRRRQRHPRLGPPTATNPSGASCGLGS